LSNCTHFCTPKLFILNLCTPSLYPDRVPGWVQTMGGTALPSSLHGLSSVHSLLKAAGSLSSVACWRFLFFPNPSTERSDCDRSFLLPSDNPSHKRNGLPSRGKLRLLQCLQYSHGPRT